LYNDKNNDFYAVISIDTTMCNEVGWRRSSSTFLFDP
jgi:hypothetical protein